MKKLISNRMKFIKKVFVISILFSISVFCYNYYVCKNFGVVVKNEIYRSGQPDLNQLEKWIKKYHLKTVVNLRGPTAPEAEIEKEICIENNIDALQVKLNAYKKMPSNRLIDLLDIIDKVQTPVLLHCNHGVDRSGTASALTAWLLGYESYEQAKKHSFVIPGPWKYRNGYGEHISHIFDDFEQYCNSTNHSFDDKQYFKDWARNIYHPDYFYVGYKTKDVLYAEPGETVEFEVKVTNLSNQVIPAGHLERRFRLLSKIEKDSEVLEPKSQYNTMTLLNSNDLKPGDSVTVTHKLHAAKEPGDYKFTIDMLEKEDHSFARQGSPEFEGNLIVMSKNENQQDRTITDSKKALINDRIVESREVLSLN